MQSQFQNIIQVETRRENDDDCYYWEAKATRGNLVSFGHGYTEETAIARAKNNLIELESKLSPVTPNWENTEIAFLASLSAADVCPDYSPSMIELAML